MSVSGGQLCVPTIQNLQLSGAFQVTTELLFISLAPVVRKLDSAIHWISRYPEDKYYDNQLRYPVDSDLSTG